MGRRRRRRREPGYAWWALLGVLLIAAMLLDSWRLGFVALLAWCLYEFSLIPTSCRVMTRQGFACHEPVRGRVFACSPDHQVVKNEALWGAAGLSRPFRKRGEQPDPNRDTGMVVFAPAVRARLSQDERIILLLAAVGAIVAIVGAVAGLFQ